MMSGDTAVLTSARPLLSLLEESDLQLQIHALQQLDSLVEHFWPEIAASIPRIETLYEKESFPRRSLAASVVSKVYYHLEELDDALKFALGAGQLVNATTEAVQHNEYVKTLINKAIDEYCRLRQEQFNKDSITTTTSAQQTAIDERLVSIVERQIEVCFNERRYKQVIGIAIESHRLDLVRRAIQHSPQQQQHLLNYTYQLSQSVVTHRKFREQLLKQIIDLLKQSTGNEAISALNAHTYINMCQCFLFLNDHLSVAETLMKLLQQNSLDATLMAYQIAFDLGENQNQPFLNRVAAVLTNQQTEAKDNTTGEAESGSKSSCEVNEIGTPTNSSLDTLSNRVATLCHILSGDAATELHMHFLYEQCATDLNILKQIKDKLEQRNSVTHNATVMSHAMMQCGTTIDLFLRDNLDWLGKAQNWAKFTATASIGVIHKGQFKQALKLLEPYLPQAGQSGSPYQEGGALYALGLIHSSNGASQISYLSNALRNSGTNEIVQHGACLGLGLAAMATQDEELFEQLKNIVMQESAVAGEAAGYAMGLVLLGSGNGVAVEEMLAYAHDTKHDKIVRGLALGIALINYGREEEADVVIEQLTSDKDPILRYGGIYTIALAYACTANNEAIQRLLYVAVSDVADDVRRAAVTALGFVLANEPEQVPRLVALLAESYNPHVRYGAAMAIGIACAAGAKARQEALKVLFPLLKDRVDFVRQAAYIAISMVMIQHNEASEVKVAEFRQLIQDSMNVKSDTMTKLGSILGAGILDAGGRNVTISLLSASGHKQMQAIVGLALFTQFWYWYPLVHLLSLAFTPTTLICLNPQLQLPKPIVIVSKAPPSTFDYPAPIDLSDKQEKKELKHVTLSVTAKQQQKQKKKEAEHQMDTSEHKTAESTMKAQENMEVDTGKVEEKSKSAEDKNQNCEKKEADKSKDKLETKKEPNFAILRNPCRVTHAQQSYLAWPRTQRYTPLKPVLAGCVMVKDTQPHKPEEILQAKQVKVKLPGIAENEPEPPAPFEYGL